MADYYIGIDLGGTNIKAGVVTDSGELLGHASVPTGGGADAVITNMITVARAGLDAAKISLDKIVAVGVTSPGALDTARGMVIKASNINGFINVPLRARISAGLERPALLANDANAAAYGEYWAGAGRMASAGPAVQDLVLITLGTGVGSGVIIGGHLIAGKHDVAGEIGHAIVVLDGVECSCGQRGCVERYCSASTMAQRAMERLAAPGEPGAATSTLQALMKSKGKINSKDVADHAQAGDEFAVAHWERTCRYLAVGCLNTIRVVDPELIVLGGGMAASGEFLRACVEKHLGLLYWNMTPVRTAVALATLENDAGLIGAAGLAKHAKERGGLAAMGS